MIFNDTFGGQGIVQDVYFGVSADALSYPIADVTRAVNLGLDEVSAIILRADNRWQFDDKNNTTLPIATTDIVASQQDYGFDDDFLEVEKVMIADQNGNFYELHNIDVNDQGVGSYLENKPENQGLARRYDVIGNSILLDPRPDYNYADGLKVYFKRKADYFTVNDTIKEPGFASEFHKYLSLFAQREYSYAKMLPKTQQLENELFKMTKKIQSYYAKRSGDVRPRVIPRIRSSR